MAETKNKAFPLIFKGVNLKQEPALLPEGAFSSTINLTSLQEGAIGPRRGSQMFTANTPLGVIHSLAKLSLGNDATDPRYCGDGSLMRRCTGPYTTFTTVNTYATTFLAPSSLPTSRWESATFNSGTSGTPYIFFAQATAMRWDNGTFTQLYPWGITAALFPATATPTNPALPGNPGYVILTTQIGGSNRLSGSPTVTSATQISQDYFQVTPSSMNGILSGMYLYMNGVLGLVDTITATTFNVYSTVIPTGSIVSYYQLVNLTSTGGSAPTLTANGSNYYGEWDNSVDWSFTGSPDDGYSSDDLVHIGLWVSNPAYITQLNIQVLVNGSHTDYYLKAVAPSSVQTYVNNATLAAQIQAAVAAAITAGSIGNVIFPSEFGSQLEPIQIAPQAAPVWMEFDIAKSDFLPVGNAGNGPFSWKQVTGVQVWALSATVTGSPAFSVEVGAIYAHGAQGPDNVTDAAALPYQYVYILRNPVTGEMGNPCPYMATQNMVTVQLRAVQVTVYGFDNSATGNPALTGFGSIAVYRAGGTFADGLFRFLGYSTNPGVDSNGFPLTATFVDNFPDLLIAGNDELEVDNYPPVASSLPTPLNTTLGIAPTPVGGSNPYPNLYSVDIGGSAHLYFTVGSQLTIGSGSNQEIANVFSVGLGFVQVWLQNQHFVGETLTCGVRIGQPCDIVCQAGNSLLLAGDVNNPHICYRSKAGYPGEWPIINLETGNSHQQIIGSPDNPIMGLLDYGGGYVSLNLKSIFIFQIWLGQFLNITETPADRGMIGKHLWCKVNNQIWFVSYDGIYAWAGGGCVKVTEDLDLIFVGIGAEGLNPIDFTQLDQIFIQSFDNYVYLSYRDTSNLINQLRYSLIYKRWEPVVYTSVAAQGALTSMMVEKDTGRLVGAIFLNGPGTSELHLLEMGTSDHYTGAPNSGNPIVWSGTTGIMAPEGRALNKQYVELLVELSNPHDTVTVGLFYDYSGTLDPVDQFTLTATTNRRFVPLQLGVSGGTVFGKEARVFAIQFTGSSIGIVQIFSVQMTYIPLAELQRGRITDWQDNGHPWDKRIYAITLDYNTYGQAIDLFLDIIGGVGGNTQTLAVQTLQISGADRSQQEFAIIDGIIAKKLRLRAQTTTTNFEIFGYQIKAENYPPDIVNFTEYDDSKSPFEKYFQQLVLDVNTNGIAIPVKIEVDGTIVQTVTVTATLNTRDVTITLNPDIMGRKARILLGTVPTNGMFQLWGASFVTMPADKAAVDHSFDYDDLGSPFDKRLITVSFEYDTGGTTTTMLMDTVTGVQGSTLNTAVQSFVLSGTGRCKQSFSITIDTIVKMVRIYPQSTTVSLRVWKYTFTKIDYPPDIVPATEWSDNGWKCEKVWRGIEVDIDTGGVACQLQLELDGSIVQTWTITTTDVDRVRILTCNSNLIGRLARMIPTPGSGGKAQIFKVTYDVWNEPCYRTILDLYENTLGYVGFKVIRQMWVEYLCAAAIVVSVYVAGDALFYQVELPAHADRDIERFFLPDQANGQYNKSKVYRIVVTSIDGVTPFKIYADSSRVESLPLSGQQRASYAEFKWSELTQPQVN
jgi:hypothetical protein